MYEILLCSENIACIVQHDNEMSKVFSRYVDLPQQLFKLCLVYFGIVVTLFIGACPVERVIPSQSKSGTNISRSLYNQFHTHAL